MSKKYIVVYQYLEESNEAGEKGDLIAYLHNEDDHEMVDQLNVDHLVWEDFDKRGCFRDP